MPSQLNINSQMSSRSEKSLFNMTKEFLKLINESTNKRIDLNFAASKLNILKRRVYDITNILEGFGLLRKINVNIAQYVGNETIDVLLENKENISVSEEELSGYINQNSQLDVDISILNKELEELLNDPINMHYLYVNSKDLVNLPSLKDKTAFAIKAHKDSFYEPGKENENHVLQISSATGQIDVFYINEDNDK